MTRFGYTLMTEQSDPRALVRYAGDAERAGFDFLACSDHYFPWLQSLGHSPYAWAVLGAVTQVTERAELLTYVTCPTMRYHPAVVAQKAATLGLLSEGRFTLGLGSGENLNEHVVGDGWPAVAVRQDSRKAAGLQSSRAIGQVPICWGPDKDRAIARAHELFRWFGGGWAVNADLPVPAGFEGASQFVRPEDVWSAIACGPDLDELAESLKPFWEAGFTDVALVQIGDESQEKFLAEIAPALLDKLRAAAT